MMYVFIYFCFHNDESKDLIKKSRTEIHPPMYLTEYRFDSRSPSHSHSLFRLHSSGFLGGWISPPSLSPASQVNASMPLLHSIFQSDSLFYPAEMAGSKLEPRVMSSWTAVVWWRFSWILDSGRSVLNFLFLLETCECGGYECWLDREF